MKKISTAILGATGMVGQNFLKILRDHPYFEVTTLCASERSSGNKMKHRLIWADPELESAYGDMVLGACDPKWIKKQGVELAFSALPADAATTVEVELAKLGVNVFSNTKSHRMGIHVPLLIPEVNLDHMVAVKDQGTKGFIVTNPNCSTTGMALALKPIYDAFGLSEVHVSTYQALSGAGYPGVPSLDILGNVIPFIDGEEEKMESEPRKILGKYSKGKFHFAEFPIVASCVRVAVKDGHLETVTLKTKRPCSAEDVARVLKNYKGRINELKLDLPTAPKTPILVSSGKNRPQPTFDVMAGGPERAKGMAVTVGRIKKVGDWIRIILLSNNVIRGAVGGSVVNAEIAFRQKYL